MDPYPNQPNPRNSQGQLGNPGFPNKTQGLATPTKIFLWNHPTEELCFETAATTSHFAVHATNTNQNRILFWGIQSALSLVNHGSITVSSQGSPGFPCPKARVSAKSCPRSPKCQVQLGVQATTLLCRFVAIMKSVWILSSKKHTWSVFLTADFQQNLTKT